MCVYVTYSMIKEKYIHVAIRIELHNICLYSYIRWCTYNFILIAHNFDSLRDKIKRIIIDDTRTRGRDLNGRGSN